MIPSQAVFAAGLILLGSDTVTMDPLVANKIMLSKAPFTPNPGTVVGDVVEADFDGYAAIAVASGSMPVAADPATGDELLSIKVPAGGFRWQTTGTTHLPETIYGFLLVDTTKATVLASALLPAPVTLTASGQEITIVGAELRQLNGSIV
jgi:hypothetical protein